MKSKTLESKKIGIQNIIDPKRPIRNMITLGLSYSNNSNNGTVQYLPMGMNKKK
jgi:hypothetical protein